MSKKIKLPAILMANDIREGFVVYATNDGWSREYKNAIIANDETSLSKLEEISTAAAKTNQVIELEIIEIEFDENNNPKPSHFREKIKSTGPTIAYGYAANGGK